MKRGEEHLEKEQPHVMGDEALLTRVEALLM